MSTQQFLYLTLPLGQVLHGIHKTLGSNFIPPDVVFPFVEARTSEQFPTRNIPYGRWKPVPCYKRPGVTQVDPNASLHLNPTPSHSLASNLCITFRFSETRGQDSVSGALHSPGQLYQNYAGRCLPSSASNSRHHLAKYCMASINPSAVILSRQM
jgi:hypothetical protein